MTRHLIALATAVTLTAAPLGAQTPGADGGTSAGILSGLMGSGGGGSGLLGGMLPNVGATSKSNAAGLLGYCVRNKLLGETSGVGAALGALTGQKQITQSGGYAAGQAGQLVAGQGQSLSLDGLRGKVKAKVCDMVLQHAQSMIGR